MESSKLPHSVGIALYQQPIGFIWKRASFEKCLVSSVQVVIFFLIVFN